MENLRLKLAVQIDLQRVTIQAANKKSSKIFTDSQVQLLGKKEKSKKFKCYCNLLLLLHLTLSFAMVYSSQYLYENITKEKDPVLYKATSDYVLGSLKVAIGSLVTSLLVMLLGSKVALQMVLAIILIVVIYYTYYFNELGSKEIQNDKFADSIKSDKES